MKNYFKTYLPLLIILVQFVACNKTENMSTKETEHHDDSEENLIELSEEQFQNAGITLGEIEMKTIGDLLKVNGKLELPPESNVSIAIPYGGFLKKTSMLPGTKVTKGQVIAVIENPDFIEMQQEYLESLVKREFLYEEFKRKELLYADEVASKKSYQQAKSNYEVNEAKVKSMSAKLKLIGFNTETVSEGEFNSSVIIYSPISGRVEEVYANVGRFVDSGDVIMNIADVEHLHVELTVYENDISKIAKGQNVWFNISGDTETKLEAEIYLLGSSVREDRSITVHAHLKESADYLLSGMYISAEIQTGSNNTTTLPEKSIVRFNAKNYVFEYLGKVQDNHQFKMIEVAKGTTQNNITAVQFVSDKMWKGRRFAIDGAFTLLGSSKNKEGEGHHH